MDTKMDSVAVWNLKPSWLNVVTSVFDGIEKLQRICTILEMKKCPNETESSTGVEYVA